MMDMWQQIFPRGYVLQRHSVDNSRGHPREIWSVQERRGWPCGANEIRAYHGTPLSIAVLICRTGFVAGPSTENGRTGVFFIGPQQLDGIQTLASGFERARDRSKNAKCPEWRSLGTPSAWSMGVVVSFLHCRDDVVACEYVHEARKWVIPRPPGTLVVPSDIRVMFDYEEFVSWGTLGRICQQPNNVNCVDRHQLCDESGAPLVMCGGKVHDPFYWKDIHDSASCGRVCAIHELEKSGWQHAKNRAHWDRIWRCPKCHF